MACRRPKRGKKAQLASAASAGADGSALDSIPEAADGAAARHSDAVKSAISKDDTLGDGLSLMDRLAGLQRIVPSCSLALALRHAVECRRA